MAVSDVVLLAIPLFVVAKMNIRTKWKASMTFMFALGGLSCVFAVWKASYLRSVRGSFDDSCTFLLILSDQPSHIWLGLEAFEVSNLS
jgi:hypothetical protein